MLPAYEVSSWQLSIWRPGAPGHWILTTNATGPRIDWRKFRVVAIQLNYEDKFRAAGRLSSAWFLGFQRFRCIREVDEDKAGWRFEAWKHRSWGHIRGLRGWSNPKEEQREFLNQSHKTAATSATGEARQPRRSRIAFVNIKP